jgi:hypothetical protein
MKVFRSFLLLSCWTASLAAQPIPRLTSLSHEWLQRGSKAELTLYGESLAGVTNILVSGAPGLSVAIVPTPANTVAVESSLGGISSVAKPSGNSVKLEIEVAPSATLSQRELRVVTPDGVSNPLTLNLTPLPEVKSSNNQSRESPQKLTLPVVVDGTIQNAAESDFFQFAGVKGEHVILDVNAYRMGSKLDSSLGVFDHNGKEVARSEDAVGLDSVLDFKVPENGDYTIELRDFRYQGGGDYKYRFTAGVLPYVRAAFPYGGQRGQTTEVELKGANLESSKLLLRLAEDASTGRQEIRAGGGKGLSNPFPFEVSDLPQFYESEPNSGSGEANRVSIPVAINGRMGKEKDHDSFKFHTDKNKRVIFEVEAYRYGSSLDAVLILTDDHGKVLQRNDDAGGPDARIDYTFQESGDFVIAVEDLLSRGGDEYGYRLTAQVPQPDFSLTITRDTARVHRGGRTPIRCEISRMNGFGAPVKIVCEDLPSGVYAEPLLIESSGIESGMLIFNASPDALLGSFPLRIVALATDRGHALRREAEPLSNDRTVKGAFLTVLEAAPFSISSATLMANVEQNQSEKIDVIVERENGFTGEIKVSPEGFSAGRDPITRSFDVQPITIKSAETRGSISLRAKTDAEIGIRPIILHAESEAGGAPLSDYTSLIPVRTTQIPFVLSTSLKKLVVTALPGSSGSAAAEGVFTVKAERRGGFSGEIDLKLEGVPEGVASTVGKIPENGGEVSVKLVASEKALTGKDIELKLMGTGVYKDRTFHFPASPITLTITAPETQETKEPKLAKTK